VHALVEIDDALVRVDVDCIAAVRMGTRQDHVVRLDDRAFVEGIDFVMAHVAGQRLAAEQGRIDFDGAVEKMNLGHDRQCTAQ